MIDAQRSYCLLCGGSGWREVRVVNGDRQVARCECRRTANTVVARPTRRIVRRNQKAQVLALDLKSQAAGDR
jgi:hypothetical protein